MWLLVVGPTLTLYSFGFVILGRSRPGCRPEFWRGILRIMRSLRLSHDKRGFGFSPMALYQDDFSGAAAIFVDAHGPLGDTSL